MTGDVGIHNELSKGDMVRVKIPKKVPVNGSPLVEDGVDRNGTREGAQFGGLGGIDWEQI